MGQRSYILVLEESAHGEFGEGIFLYTHWGGKRLPLLVRTVLALRLNWECPPILTRLLFSRMTAGIDDSDLNFGISHGPFDTDFNVLVIDVEAQSVLMCEEERILLDGVHEATLAKWSFEEYIHADAKDILAAWTSKFPEPAVQTSTVEVG